MGYALAGFTTFATILGRYNYGSNNKIDSCCCVLKQDAGTGFIPNLKTTFRNFVVGIAMIPQSQRQLTPAIQRSGTQSQKAVSHTLLFPFLFSFLYNMK
jgi:hypothetical protein